MLTCLKIGTTDFSIADNASFCVELLILKSTCDSFLKEILGFSLRIKCMSINFLHIGIRRIITIVVFSVFLQE